MIFGYTRCSTQDQADAYSIATQAAAIEQVIPVDAFYIDKAISGGTPFQLRPAGQQLLNVVQPGDSIVVSKLDRGFRDTANALAIIDDCRKKGVSIRILDVSNDDLTNSIVGEMTMTVVAAMATFERRRISERTKEGLATVKRQGKKLGAHRPNCAAANQKNRQLALDWAETHKELVSEYLVQGISQQRIARLLNLSGMTTRTGKPWTQPHVSRLIKRINQLAA